MKLETLYPIFLSALKEPSTSAGQIVSTTLSKYAAPRKWLNLDYLWLGLKEYKRLIGEYPLSHAMVAWLYHAVEEGDEVASSVAFLRDSRALGYTFDEAEDTIIPIIQSSNPRLPSSSVVGDMRLVALGQKRIHYLSYARKLRQVWKFLDDETWRLGRIVALKTLLERPQLYFRREFERDLAGIARENILAELTLMGWTPPAPLPPPPAVEEAVIPVKIMPMPLILPVKKETEDKAPETQDPPVAPTE